MCLFGEGHRGSTFLILLVLLGDGARLGSLLCGLTKFHTAEDGHWITALRVQIPYLDFWQEGANGDQVGPLALSLLLCIHEVHLMNPL